MQQLPTPFIPLAEYKQWLCYQLVPSKRYAGKFDKFPVSPLEGRLVDAHDPSHWVDYETAANTARHWGEGFGVAFVFTSKDPFFFVDIDGAFDGQNWSDVATYLIGMFPGAAVEVSQSQTGLHIIGQYQGDEPDHGCKNIALGLELYTSARFVALTGLNVTGDASTVHNEALNSVISTYFTPELTNKDFESWTDEPLQGYRPIKDDDELIKKACESKSTAAAFGKASFTDLWNENIETLSTSYPDDVRDYDASSADAALAQHLLFWTCGDCERTMNLMRQSGLDRAKWDWHKKYLKTTILNAFKRAKAFYSKNSDVEIKDDVENIKQELEIREGFQFMSPDQQIQFFKGCVYVCDVNRVFTPRGSFLKSDQFNAMYGGYEFGLDADGEKSTKKAWEAFTLSQAVSFPRVDASCFRPHLESGQIIIEEGFRLVNSYVPIETRASNSDVTPFLTHLRKLLPDERDQVIILSYMAACVQFKGYKIQWAPLIQGAEGNGKTLFTRCLAYAIGERYTHMPRADEMGEKFNAWLFGKLFIGVEDIYVPDQKRELLEVLKPMITNKRLAKRAMQTDQIMGDVCANFIFNSNHKDAVRKTHNDRRFCVFYTAQQEAEHIIRDGMGGDYFPKLYDWLDSGGYATVNGFLQSYKIPNEFNPTTTCQRAPKTSSTDEAVQMSMGAVEQEIMEAIEENRTGFAGGWVSSFALDKLLKDMRKDRQVPQNRRRELMKSLGYDYHPALTNGRVNTVIPIDNGKPRIFCKIGHINNNLQSSAEVVRHYSIAQGDPLALKAASVDNPVKSV